MRRALVILSQWAHWRENPYLSKWEVRIATPVCGLVRNDRQHFATGPFLVLKIGIIEKYTEIVENG